MWTCMRCRQSVEDEFDTCWNCGTSKDGLEDPDFMPEEPVTASQGAGRDIECLRCHRELDFMGSRSFHEGPRWGFLGNVGEFFVRSEGFDVYVCSHCGHVEFFASGIGLHSDELAAEDEETRG